MIGKNSKAFRKTLRKQHRRTFQKNKNKKKNFIHLFFVFAFLWNCQTESKRNRVPQDNQYDFYFGTNYLQIIGTAKIPDFPRESFARRLELCVNEAKIHAHSKWLGVTEKYVESQKLWLEQLQNNYYSLWKPCLDSAKIHKVIPVYPDECKIIIHYSCDPRKW